MVLFFLDKLPKNGNFLFGIARLRICYNGSIDARKKANFENRR